MRFIFAFFLSFFMGLAACAAPTASSQTRAQDQKAAEATLVQFYEAAAKADFDSFIATFSKTAKFYGTDATEIWPYEEFSSDIKNSFATNGGWDFDLKDRQITLSQNGEVAWFAELTHFNNTDYLLRPTGVMQKEDGVWKIVQIVMGIPIPNVVYPPVLQGLQATELGADVETAKIDKVLNALHEFAAKADGDAYFNLYADDAIFLGTDVSERWTKAQFQAYALPFFNQGKGWRYTPRARHIMLSPMGNMAWFDETLESENYGTSRGSGVLIRTKTGWKISQYNLTFPIPNDLADEMTAKIKAFEKK